MPELKELEALKDAQLVALARAPALGDSLAALKQLARRASPARAQIFEELLKAPKTPPKARRTIATLCAGEASPSSRALLTLALRDPDDLVVRKAARSLGEIGAAADLTTLEGMRPAAVETQEAVAFASALISYRHGLNKHLLAVPRGAAVAVASGFELKVEARAVSDAALASARAELPGLGLADRGAVAMDCRGVRLLLAFTDAFPDPGAIAALAKAPARPLVLAHSGLSTGEFALSEHLLTQPEGRGKISMIGARPGGAITFVGELSLAGGQVSFELRSVATRYASAIDFAGSYEPASGSWTFTRRQSSELVAAPKGGRKGPQVTVL